MKIKYVVEYMSDFTVKPNKACMFHFINNLNDPKKPQPQNQI